ncbi:hypothetical protein CCZ01_02300 [Helicobacter monodelphidis]|uniref:hypothetical protein n=1 Tax=Helicobacter sp. 15-1451 TaxID=2004995 RepID=UPI000DCC3DD4|nr:hypothetical protein [Helicobacter sp. 15-1451]RAX58634.1 hypothetical protein CCZ01_02300 [Helicobacter sp. 15-1451]
MSCWETQFKVAIVERDPEKLIVAFEALPQEFESREKAEEALSYLEQGIEIFQESKGVLKEKMDNIRKIRQFVRTNPYGQSTLQF